MRKTGWLLLLATLLVLLAPNPAHAYIGPGAGFALAGSFLAVFAAICSAILMLITWPVRLFWRALFGWRALARSRFKRVVVLGLDGLDYTLTERMLAEGKLPHLAALREQGCFKPLGTTLPSISPVAWSSFQTGTNPGKHNIYDFLIPDPDTYRPKLSSVEIRPPRPQGPVRRHGQGRRPRRPQDRRGQARAAHRRVHRVGPRPVPRRARRLRIRRLQVPAPGVGRRVRAVRDADQHRPGKPGDA